MINIAALEEYLIQQLTDKIDRNTPVEAFPHDPATYIDKYMKGKAAVLLKVAAGDKVRVSEGRGDYALEVEHTVLTKDFRAVESHVGGYPLIQAVIDFYDGEDGTGTSFQFDGRFYRAEVPPGRGFFFVGLDRKKRIWEYAVRSTLTPR